MRSSPSALCLTLLLCACASRNGTPDNAPTLKTLAGREAQVAPDRRRALVEDAVRQLRDMGARQRQQGEPSAQRLFEGKLSRHRLIGQGGDLGADRGGVGRAGQGDVGQNLQCLDAHERRVEVKDIGGRLSHAPTLADLRTCSNKRVAGP